MLLNTITVLETSVFSEPPFQDNVSAVAFRILTTSLKGPEQLFGWGYLWFTRSVGSLPCLALQLLKLH